MIIEAKHNLVLIKAAVGVVLVNDEHLASVPIVNIIGEEHVNVVAVNTHCATNVAVSVVHLAFPLPAVSISALTHAALRLLNGDVERTNLHMPLLIVAGFLLRLGMVVIHLNLQPCPPALGIVYRYYSRIMRVSRDNAEPVCSTRRHNIPGRNALPFLGLGVIPDFLCALALISRSLGHALGLLEYCLFLRLLRLFAACRFSAQTRYLCRHKLLVCPGLLQQLLQSRYLRRIILFLPIRAIQAIPATFCIFPLRIRRLCRTFAPERSFVRRRNKVRSLRPTRSLG